MEIKTALEMKERRNVNLEHKFDRQHKKVKSISTHQNLGESWKRE